MIDRSGPLPLYFQIVEYLREQILSLTPDTRIPSEHELAAFFKVSRGTVKQAVTELVREGLLYRVQGKGTFVAQPRISQRGSCLVSFTEEITRQGYSTWAKILEAREYEANDRIREILGLEKPGKVYLIRRVRYIEQDPMAVVTSHIPADIASEHGLSLNDFFTSVYGALSSVGLYPVKAKDVYSAGVAGHSTAELLDVPVGSAIFRTQRIAYLEDNRPIEYAEGVIQGRDYTITVEPHRDAVEGAPMSLRAFWLKNDGHQGGEE